MKRNFAGAVTGAWLIAGLAAATMTAMPVTGHAAEEAPKPKGTKAIGVALNAAMTALG